MFHIDINFFPIANRATESTPKFPTFRSLHVVCAILSGQAKTVEKIASSEYVSVNRLLPEVDEAIVNYVKCHGSSVGSVRERYPKDVPIRTTYTGWILAAAHWFWVLIPS